MPATSGNPDGQRVRRWLQDNSAVRERAIEAIGLTEAGLGNAVLTEPELLVELFEQNIQEAINEDAPADVIRDLRSSVNKMRSGVGRLRSNEYLMNTLAQLQGLEERGEIEAVLERAADQAPDGRTRQMVDDAVASMREVTGWGW